MDPHLQRAQLLYDQSRYDLAEQELRQALAQEPHEPFAHALLALTLSERGDFRAATEAARQAINLAPDSPFNHYAMAAVLIRRDRFDEAHTAIQEAIRLDPSDPDYYSVLAAIHVDEKRWAQGLAAADQGLAIDPEHVNCANLRAMALVKMGRRAEAGATIDTALAKNPEDAMTHANQGWTWLEKGDPNKALDHFRESLRLDPEDEWAREGIIESLKARYFIYSWVLKYFFWMSRFSSRTQWLIILGGYFGNRLLSAAAHDHEALAPWVLPLRLLYLLVVLLTWTADSLFNLLLRLNKFGRLALTPEKVTATNWIGACLAGVVGGLALWVFSGFNYDFLIAAGAAGFLIIPMSAVFKCRPGWPRRVMAGYTGMAALCGGLSVGLIMLAEGIPTREARDLLSLGISLISIYLLAVFGSTWVANFLIMQRPKR